MLFKRILASRAYWEFKNLLFTLEHYLGTFIYHVDNLFPPSDYAPPYCYKCKKSWFEIIEESRRRLTNSEKEKLFEIVCRRVMKRNQRLLSELSKY